MTDNTKRSLLERELLSNDGLRLEFDKERATSEFIDQLDAALQIRGMNRSGLANALGKSRAFITQTLRRGSNMTIKTMVELVSACDYEIHVALMPRSAGVGHSWTEPMQSPMQNSWEPVPSVARCTQRDVPAVFEATETLVSSDSIELVGCDEPNVDWRSFTKENSSYC